MSVVKARNVNHPDHTHNLNSEKYTIIREAMLASLPPYDDAEGIDFIELENRVTQYLKEKDVPATMFPKPGSVRWYTKSVQLDLEARGKIERIPSQTPIRLRKSKTD